MKKKKESNLSTSDLKILAYTIIVFTIAVLAYRFIEVRFNLAPKKNVGGLAAMVFKTR